MDGNRRRMLLHDCHNAHVAHDGRINARLFHGAGIFGQSFQIGIVSVGVARHVTHGHPPRAPAQRRGAGLQARSCWPARAGRSDRTQGTPHRHRNEAHSEAAPTRRREQAIPVAVCFHRHAHPLQRRSELLVLGSTLDKQQRLGKRGEGNLRLLGLAAALHFHRSPSFTPRLPTTTCTGQPIRSASANLTPARSSRSSMTTSRPRPRQLLGHASRQRAAPRRRLRQAA